MNTISKELEFPAPPEGWEIDRYGSPAPGEAFHSNGDWHILSPTDLGRRSACYLISRKKQSPAEWANAQPDLAALARVFPMGTMLHLGSDGRHVLQGGSGGGVTLHWAGAPAGSLRIGEGRGRWEGVP